MTVLTIVHQRHAVAIFGNIHVFMRAGFKFCLLPRGVAVNGTLDITKLNIKRRLIRKDVYGELHFQHQVLLLPIHVGFKVDTRHAIR